MSGGPNIYQERWTERLECRIHPSCRFGDDIVMGFGVIIEEGVSIGNNALIDHYTVIRPDVRIGDHSEIRQFCFIAEGASIGEQVKIFQFSNICKNAVIEDRVYIGPKVVLTNTKKISHNRQYRPVIDPPIIRYGARIGTGAIIMPGVIVGRNALVGARSIVTHDVPDNAIVKGIAACIVGEVPEEERL